MPLSIETETRATVLEPDSVAEPKHRLLHRHLPELAIRAAGLVTLKVATEDVVASVAGVEVAETIAVDAVDAAVEAASKARLLKVATQSPVLLSPNLPNPDLSSLIVESRTNFHISRSQDALWEQCT